MPTAQTLNYLDFVDLPDHHFVTLFINDRNRERSYDRNVLILPPPALRRTAQDIREFFNLGKTQKRAQIKRYANHIIDKSSSISYLDSKFSGLHHEQIADDFKDAMASVPAEEVPPVEAQEMEQCKGVTLGYVRGLQTFITDRTEKRELGFKHTVRDGFATRTKLEHPDNSSYVWWFTPPVVGVLVDNNTGGDGERGHYNPHRI